MDPELKALYAEILAEDARLGEGVEDLIGMLGSNVAKEVLRDEIKNPYKFYDYDPGKKSTLKSTPKISFSKSSRFQYPKENLTKSEKFSSPGQKGSLSQFEEMQLPIETENLARNLPGGKFGQKSRFSEQKLEQKKIYDSTIQLNPNYVATKRRVTGGVIAPESEFLSKKVKKNSDQENWLKSKTAHRKKKRVDENESIDTLQSIETMDTMNDSKWVGPGKYDLNWNGVIGKTHGGGFGHAGRFNSGKESTESKSGKEYAQEMVRLDPRVEYTRPSSKTGPVWAKPTRDNEKLISKREQSEILERVAAEMELRVAKEKAFDSKKAKRELRSLSRQKKLKVDQKNSAGNKKTDLFQ
jgi:hypothetical protein